MGYHAFKHLFKIKLILVLLHKRCIVATEIDLYNVNIFLWNYQNKQINYFKTVAFKINAFLIHFSVESIISKIFNLSYRIFDLNPYLRYFVECFQN